MSKKVLIGVLGAALAALLVDPALAQDHKEAAAGGASKDYLGLAVAFAMALAAFGGAISQGRATAAAAEAVARQPEAGGRIQTMMIIGLALIETLVLYTLLIAFMLNGKV
jgi:F-type H+-transporting ATPase subunit c